MTMDQQRRRARAREGRCWLTGKRRYATLIFAERQRERHGEMFGEEMKSYWCQHCDGFHLTKQLRPESEIAELDRDPGEWERVHGMKIRLSSRAQATHRWTNAKGTVRYYRAVSARHVEAAIGVIKFVAWIRRGMAEEERCTQLR